MGEEKAEPKRRAASVLSAAKVKTAGPGKYHDGGGLGLILRVDPNGARFWVQRITVHGKRREIGLGSPPVVSLADARDAALANKKLLRTGADPLAEKRKSKESITFAEACEHYMASKLAEFDNDKHRKQWPATLNAYAKPKIGHLLVRAITTADVLRVLEPIWNEKNETASRLRGRIEAVLSWATVAGHRTGDNPARWAGNLKELLPKPSKVAKGDNQPALALGDVARWWSDLEKRDGMAAQALQFLTLTAARSGEVRGMVWDEVNLDPANSANPAKRTGLWTIPASRMKAGREHRVALTPEAVAILEAIPRMDGSPFVFFAARGGALSDMSISAVMRRMQESEEKAGRPGYLDPKNKRPAVPHGLRSTFRQWAAERGYPRDMAELALAHFIGSDVERAYQRSDMLERRRAMMADWGSFLCNKKSQANVIQIGQDSAHATMG
ncbi:site-specific integrase [Pseudorhodobacter sp. MZDSW-24AT]|uniref:tyrosine-type recombinase/integrase n=1 Tax=Pseudorhodobacter sp. MZDSW-24AT TaxID=2052957 RepID=UPI000C1E2041|nr:site-specific integrase [Pseudorhodobacter sp. MZDSW-24AT]PJF08383.1 integrase [Pseudorhodobacter sp. MZDSW-24AT]